MMATRTIRPIGVAITVALGVTLISARILAAHDFWLVPNALAYVEGGQVEILGQSGTRFPVSDGPTQPTQVSEARIVGASSSERIADLSVNGKSLVIRHKPAAAGQQIVAIALGSRSARTTPDRLKRYIAGEGAPEPPVLTTTLLTWTRGLRFGGESPRQILGTARSSCEQMVTVRDALHRHARRANAS